MKKRVISAKTKRHSSRGDFYYPKKYAPKRVLYMKSGGHGQENIWYLQKRRVSYGVDTEYSNGVRLGHIDSHRDKRNGRPNGHAWFPANWSREDISQAGLHIASLRKNQHLVDGQMYTGRYKGVSVGIIARKNRIKTIFPCFNVNLHAKKASNVIIKRNN